MGLALATMPAASAHEGNNHGTIKVHDEEEVDPARRNDPHVSCEFWIEGFNMADDSGHLEFYSIPPTNNPPVFVMADNWTGTAEADGDGFHFIAGPYELPEGHYRVEAYLDQPHPGATEHFAKSKVFWVNPCEPERQAPPCPPGLEATAEEDGDIHLDWNAVENASEYRVYRATGEDDLQYYASTNATEFTDTDTEIGTTYRYTVTAVVEGQESENCEEVEVTAIPFFPGLLAGAVAVLGTVGAFMVARRR